LAGLRIGLESVFYSRVLKPIFFSFDPELVHNTFINTGEMLGSNPLARGATKLALNYQNPMLEQTLMGVGFRNPVGLSAGFDKDGRAAMIMRSVGFGFAEIGSITAKPCRGNEGIRLKRIPERKSILVHLGLNNDGAEAIHERMKGRTREYRWW